MSTVETGDKVLVTGANGFVAIWIIRVLLERGYAVRGTVRSKEKGHYLNEKFKAYGSQFELAIVRDLVEDGVFDEAVKGVVAVVHAASPSHLNAEDPQDVILPAVKGTTSLLHSVLNHGSGIKRVIYVSSASTVLRPDKNKDEILDENDWNDYDINEVDTLGVKASALVKYRASKTLAEKAAWDIYEKNKHRISWDLTTLIPPMVLGPTLNEVSSPDALNQSLALFYKAVLVEDAIRNIPPVSGFIDVRDVATATVLSLEKDAAGGERIIISSAPFSWQDLLDTANALSPSPMPGRKFVVGDSRARRTAQPTRISNEKGLKILGIKYRSLEEVTRDTLVDFRNRGW